MVSGSDQVVDVAPGVARVALIVFDGTPGRQVVLEVLVGVPVPDLDLDPLDPAGGRARAVDRERHAGSSTRPSIGLMIAVSLAFDAGIAVEVVERDAADVLPALGVGVTTGDDATRGDQHGLVALEGVGARVPLQRLAVDRVDRADVVADDDLVAQAVAGGPGRCRSRRCPGPATGPGGR